MKPERQWAFKKNFTLPVRELGLNPEAQFSKILHARYFVVAQAVLIVVSICVKRYWFSTDTKESILLFLFFFAVLHDFGDLSSSTRD